MSSALVTTAGATNANAYVSVDTANAYFLDRPPLQSFTFTPTWAGASDARKRAGILWATKLLDRLYVWNGYVVTHTQALLWPRAGLYYPNGQYVPNDLIPTQLQEATAEFAAQLLEENRAEDSVGMVGLERLKVGGLELEFSGGSGAPVTPDAVRRLIPQEWGFPRDRSIMREVVRA